MTREQLIALRRMVDNIINDVDTEINNTRYNDNYYDMNKAFDVLSDKYGAEMVADVVAIMVQDVGKSDMRISNSARAWAADRLSSFYKKNELSSDFTERIHRGTIHSCLLEGFTKRVIKRMGG